MEKNNNDWTGGQPFFKWWWKTQAVGKFTLGFILFMMIATGCTGGFDEAWQFWALEGFFAMILGIFSFKSWQHWNDLRNGRSR